MQRLNWLDYAETLCALPTQNIFVKRFKRRQWFKGKKDKIKNRVSN
jgi:hypothetical protein